MSELLNRLFPAKGPTDCCSYLPIGCTGPVDGGHRVAGEAPKSDDMTIVIVKVT